MAKKTEVPKEGIFIFKNSRGFGFRVKQNKFILASAQGYNNRANAIKGLRALDMMLANCTYVLGNNENGIIDLTKSVKPKTTKSK